MEEDRAAFRTLARGSGITCNLFGVNVPPLTDFREDRHRRNKTDATRRELAALLEVDRAEITITKSHIKEIPHVAK
jgi:hypothetical protein